MAGCSAAFNSSAPARLATGREIRLPELGALDQHVFRLFLNLLGEALAAQAAPHMPVERTSGDGLLLICLEAAGGRSRRGRVGCWAYRDHDRGRFAIHEEAVVEQMLEDLSEAPGR